MNSDTNKEVRKRYVESLNAHIREEKEILWIDETNFLAGKFCFHFYSSYLLLDDVSLERHS